MEITLLTHAFPFPPGEQFVATELGYLAEAFGAVHVVPTAAVSAGILPRSLPPRVYLRDDVQKFLERRRRDSKWGRAWASLGDRDGRRLWQTELQQRDFLDDLSPGRLALRLRQAAAAIGHALMVRDALRAAHVPGRIYSFWAHPGVLGAALARLGPLAARAHGADLYRERHRSGYVPLQRQIQQCLDALFFISEHGRHYSATRYPDLVDRYHVSRLGVPAALVRARPSEDGVLRIVSCATVLPVKRLDLLLAAVQGYPKPLEWTHLGGGPGLSALQARARALPDHVKVRWKGEVDVGQVHACYQRSPVDLYVCCSESEGLPVAIMEAMSYGVAVMATAVGGIPELVDVDNGVPLSADILAGEMTQALQRFAELSPLQKAAMGEAALRTWQERVDAARQCPSFCATLQHVARLPAFPCL